MQSRAPPNSARTVAENGDTVPSNVDVYESVWSPDGSVETIQISEMNLSENDPTEYSHHSQSYRSPQDHSSFLHRNGNRNEIPKSARTATQRRGDHVLSPHDHRDHPHRQPQSARYH